MLKSLNETLKAEKYQKKENFPLHHITFLVLLVLKLTNLSSVNISWFWVFFPLWIETALGTILLLYLMVRDNYKKKKLAKAFWTEKEEYRNKQKEKEEVKL